MLRLAVLMAMMATPALAAPPPPASEDAQTMAPYAHWIETQHDPAGRWCCSIADGRPVDARITSDGHWEVRFVHPDTLSDDAAQPPPAGWVDVPDSAVVHAPNPVGVPLAWWYRGRVQCFAPVGGV